MSIAAIRTSGHPWALIAPLAAVAVLAVALVAWPTPAAAQFGSTEIEPIDGLWCGMTDTGGSIRFDVTPDGRFVQNIDIRTTAGTFSTSEGDRSDLTQIKSSKFQYRDRKVTRNCSGPSSPRQPGGPSRCVRAPCRPISAPPPSQRCTTTVTETTIRGTFDAPDSAHGSYKLSGHANQNGTLNGLFTAWPASVAGCP